jgi:hypothetical protein
MSHRAIVGLILSLVLFSATVCLAAAGQASTSYTLQHSVIGSSAPVRLYSRDYVGAVTAGEPTADQSSGGGYVLRAGYPNLAPAPLTEGAYLPLVRR